MSRIETDLPRRQIVEHQQARIALARLLLQPAKCLRGARSAAPSPRTSTSMNAASLARIPGALERQRRRFFFAPRNQRQMIVLDQDGVAEPQAVRSAAAQMHGALVEQAPQRLARGDNCASTGSGGARAPAGTACAWRCRTSAAAGSVRRARATATGSGSPSRLQQKCRRLERFAVFLLERRRDSVRTRQERRIPRARGDAGLPRQHRRARLACFWIQERQRSGLSASRSTRSSASVSARTSRA